MYHRIHSLKCVGVPNFASITQSFPKTEVPMYVHSVRAVHVHYAPYQEMTCTIEIHSLNSISVPNLESIAQSFLEPEDPSRIKFSGVGARSLHPTGTETTKAHTSGQFACNLQVSHQRCPLGCIVSLESRGAHDITWRRYVKRQYLAKFSRKNVFPIDTRGQKRSSFLQNYLFFLENIL